MWPYHEIKACLFDMDGTLINTEDIYTEASNELLAKFGKGPLTWDVKIKLQGRPGVESAKIMVDLYDLSCTPEELMAMAHKIQQTKWLECKFLPGALPLLERLRARDFPIALGTSSCRNKFVEKTTHLEKGFGLFQDQIVTGDDPRIPPGKGKPQPDIWFACLEGLNKVRKQRNEPPIRMEECLIFEDGIPGVESGIAAAARVIWIPDAAALRLLDGKETEIIGDHGEILKSLEDFDVSKYGL